MEASARPVSGVSRQRAVSADSSEPITVHGFDAFPSATSAGYERLDATAPRLALIVDLRD
jgi:hypothetical protein